MNVNVWDVQDDIQALIASRDAVDREKLADDGVPLAERQGVANQLSVLPTRVALSAAVPNASTGKAVKNTL